MLNTACNKKDSTNAQTNAKVEKTEKLPLIYKMSFLSRYTSKLWLSGQAENWELAEIYHHEIEEIVEEISKDEIIDDGVHISELMDAMMLPMIKELKNPIQKRNLNDFSDKYNVMIQTCNQCHRASNYGAVKITKPTVNSFNQDFGNSD